MESVNANILPAMLEKQKRLLDHYIKIEGLPQYPIDLSTKKGQRVVKDFVGRFTEELAEAYDTLDRLNQLANDNGESRELKHLLAEYNVEIGDTWHFLLDVILYAGFEDRLLVMVQRWINTQENFKGMWDETPFGTLFKVGGIFNFQAKVGKYHSGFDRKEVISDVESVHFPLLAGGRKVSNSEMQNHALLLWDVVLYFHKFTNQLKNREWHQSEKELDLIAVDNAFVEALLSFAIYMEFALFTQQSISHCYSHKNEINQERIKSGR